MDEHCRSTGCAEPPHPGDTWANSPLPPLQLPTTVANHEPLLRFGVVAAMPVPTTHTALRCDSRLVCAG